MRLLGDVHTQHKTQPRPFFPFGVKPLTLDLATMEMAIEKYRDNIQMSKLELWGGGESGSRLGVQVKPGGM